MLNFTLHNNQVLPADAVLAMVKVLALSTLMMFSVMELRVGY